MATLRRTFTGEGGELRLLDRQSAGILIVLGGVAFILWYRTRSEAQRAALAATGTSPTPATGGGSGLGSTGVLGGSVQGVGSLLTGQRISQEANAFVGQSTQGLPGYPRRACASWVSEVLSNLGLINACYPSVSGLEGAVSSAGATVAAPLGTSTSSYSNLQPGDVVFFADASGLRHTAIYQGGGNVIGNLSSTGKVGSAPLSAFGSAYEAYRFQ